MSNIRRLLFAVILCTFLSCASAPKGRMSHIQVPDCTPGHVIFVENTYKDAWVELGNGLLVRRVELGMADEDCTVQDFSPPMFGFFLPEMVDGLKTFILLKGEWFPSEEVPGKGHYEYIILGSFKGKTVQGVYNIVADFVKEILVKKEK